MKRERANLCHASLVAALLMCFACSGEADSYGPASTKVQEIISGDTVPRGSLATIGIVKVGGCTGTLLTNQHVLTAAHCMPPAPPVGVTLEGPTPAQDQFVLSSNIYPSTGTSGTQADDYAIVELSSPLIVDGRDDSFVNLVYPFADSTLVGSTGFCAGYGFNLEANPGAGTLGGGAGTLRSAMLDISHAGSGIIHVARTSGKVGSFGDSGSTCFVDGFVTGVQSNMLASWSDQNGNMSADAQEYYNIVHVFSASPGSHRAFSEAKTQTAVKVSLLVVPSIGPQLVTVNYETPMEFRQVELLNGAEKTHAKSATRSGRVTAAVEEPERMMCNQISVRAPLSGDVELKAVCLGDGLVSALL